jgi:IMP dehydrogenase
MGELRIGLTFDDVVIVPRRSRVRSRADVSTRTRLSNTIPLEIPVISANMDTVTTAPMAIAMAQIGGIGALHRFLRVEDQADEVRRVKRYLNYVIEDPYLVAPDRTIAEAQAEAEAKQVTGLVVVDDDHRPLGILTARDVRAAGPGARVADVMTPAERLVTASPRVTLEEARAIMHRRRVEKLPLVDDRERLAGLITLHDIDWRERWPQATRDERGRLRVAAAVGVRGDYRARAEALIDAEVDALVLDIAHGHAEHALDAATELKKAWPDCPLIVGNVATPEGVADLASAGADAVKVGIGPGFACSTRLVAGVGVPQLTAILDCAEAAHRLDIPIVADGGIRRPGDLAKAIGAGASTVMVGSLFAGRSESPGDVVRRDGVQYKVYRGMASRSAAAARLGLEGRTDDLDQYVPEGEEIEIALKGPVAEAVTDLVGGLRSAMSYVDATTIDAMWAGTTFVRQTEAGRAEARPGPSA